MSAHMVNDGHIDGHAALPVVLLFHVRIAGKRQCKNIIFNHIFLIYNPSGALHFEQWPER